MRRPQRAASLWNLCLELRAFQLASKMAALLKRTRARKLCITVRTSPARYSRTILGSVWMRSEVRQGSCPPASHDPTQRTTKITASCCKSCAASRRRRVQARPVLRAAREERGIPPRVENQPSPRAAHYVCVIALAQRGRILCLTEGRADGVILDEPRGTGGFGYDPYFFYAPLGKTFAELKPEEKFAVSHRGKAFRKLLAFLSQE